MKKTLAAVAALFIAAISSATVFASGINSNEQAVLDELKTGVMMQGAEMYWPGAYVNQAENYFNTIDMTAAQAELIAGAIGEGRKALESTGAANLADCTAQQKKELMLTLSKVMEPVNGTASYDKTTGEVSLKAEDGSVIFKAVPTLVSKDGKALDVNGKATDGGVIKITGASADSSAFIFAGAAVVIAAGVVIFAVRKKNNGRA